ncbi:MAG: hypothetical protein LBQ68_04640 [Clostridiales bacterium]|jgi:flavodoxin|nr:hypothetical protein [Clostridiales bacterium]
MAQKNLIVYFSRTGSTESVAKVLAAKLGCDTDKLYYADREKISFANAGLESLRKQITTLKGDEHDPGIYDKIFFVSPVWAGSLSTPIRSYMKSNKDKIKDYALIVTCGGSGVTGPGKEALAIIGKSPSVTGSFRTLEIKRGEYDLTNFVG